MRWPWVSREAYEAMTLACDNWREWEKEERIRYDALLEKYHALRLQGAEPLPTIADLPFHAPSGPDPDAEFRVLIAEQAGTDLRQRAVMLRQLRQDRADGVSPEEIRQAIERGVQSDGVPT